MSSPSSNRRSRIPRILGLLALIDGALSVLVRMSIFASFLFADYKGDDASFALWLYGVFGFLPLWYHVPQLIGVTGLMAHDRWGFRLSVIVAWVGIILAVGFLYIGLLFGTGNASGRFEITGKGDGMLSAFFLLSGLLNFPLPIIILTFSTTQRFKEAFEISEPSVAP